MSKLREALEKFDNMKLDCLEEGVIKLMKKSEWYEKGDEDFEFFTEKFLYPLFGKEDARTILALWNNVKRAAQEDNPEWQTVSILENQYPRDHQPALRIIVQKPVRPIPREVTLTPEEVHELFQTVQGYLGRQSEREDLHWKKKAQQAVYTLMEGLKIKI